MEDPNSTILEEEPAAIAVVPPACTSDNSAGPSSRPGLQCSGAQLMAVLSPGGTKPC